MSTSSTMQKLEQAAVALLNTKNLGCPVYRGISSNDKDGPCVICVAEKGPEEPLDTGNYKLKLRVNIKAMPEVDETGINEFHRLAGAVMDVFKSYSIAEDLTDSLEDFTAIGVKDLGPETSVDETTWVEEQVFEVYCCASDI